MKRVNIIIQYNTVRETGNFLRVKRTAFKRIDITKSKKYEWS